LLHVEPELPELPSGLLTRPPLSMSSAAVGRRSEYLETFELSVGGAISDAIGGDAPGSRPVSSLWRLFEPISRSKFITARRRGARGGAVQSSPVRAEKVA